MSSYAITGAARGLGLELVNQISSNSANTVFALVRSASSADKVKKLSESRSNIHIIEADVSNGAAMISAAEAVSKVTGGSLDVLIHNANSGNMKLMGLSPSAFSPDKADWVRTSFNDSFDTGIYGTIFTTNAFIPLIENGKQKKIVNISSAMGYPDFVNQTDLAYAVPYSVSKAAMNMLVAKYAAELKDKGIHVVALSPGWVATQEEERKSCIDR
jgi:NAD(P)-dependent dehydrogenase (short-subunit alcohol dehydrogenase family)